LGRLTEEKRDSILSTYEKTKNYTEAARIEDVDPRTIKAAVEGAKQEDEVSEEQAAESKYQPWRAIELFAQGKSVSQVCVALHADIPDVEFTYAQFLRAERLALLREAYDKGSKDDFRALTRAMFMITDNKLDPKILVAAHEEFFELGKVRPELERVEREKQDGQKVIEEQNALISKNNERIGVLTNQVNDVQEIYNFVSGHTEEYLAHLRRTLGPVRTVQY
jgi:hypothetical protein